MSSMLTSDEEYDILCRMLPLEQILKGGAQAQDISQWVCNVQKSIDHRAQLTQEEMNSVISFGLHRWSHKEARAKSLYIRYLEYISVVGKA